MPVDKNTQVEALLNALDSPRFLRKPLARSDHRTRVLIHHLRTTVEVGEPLKLLVMWGAGSKLAADNTKARAVKFLESYAARVKRVWPQGVTFSILFTDTHAVLNGYDLNVVNKYFDSVRCLFDDMPSEFTYSYGRGRCGKPWYAIDR